MPSRSAHAERLLSRGGRLLPLNSGCQVIRGQCDNASVRRNPRPERTTPMACSNAKHCCKVHSFRLKAPAIDEVVTAGRTRRPPWYFLDTQPFVHATREKGTGASLVLRRTIEPRIEKPTVQQRSNAHHVVGHPHTDFEFPFCSALSLSLDLRSAIDQRQDAFASCPAPGLAGDSLHCTQFVAEQFFGANFAYTSEVWVSTADISNSKTWVSATSLVSSYEFLVFGSPHHL